MMNDRKSEKKSRITIFLKLHEVHWIDINNKGEPGRAEPVGDLISHLFYEERGEFSFIEFDEHMVTVTSPYFCNAGRCWPEHTAVLLREMPYQCLPAGECGLFRLFFVR